MQVQNIAECSPGEHSAILSTFIKLPFVIKMFVMSIFEWLFYTGFTVHNSESPKYKQEHRLYRIQKYSTDYIYKRRNEHQQEITSG